MGKKNRTLKWMNIILVYGLFGNVVYGQNESYRNWQWQKSTCEKCRIILKMNPEDLKNLKFVEFVQTLEKSKFEIVKLYKSDPQEYNLLAYMAVGILGNESGFFENWRYKVKSNTQLAITTAKVLKVAASDKSDIDFVQMTNPFGFLIEISQLKSMTNENSKGPTQIKQVPEKISKYYNIKETDLWNPKNAARATMGFLIESLLQLRRMARNNNLEFIKKDTYIDYLPYIYFGKSKSLKDRTATPEKNIYVKNMKKHMQQVQPIEVY